jgi:hypothetical protein
MKTALCLYGQARDVNTNWKYLLKNIIEPNDVDVFFHTWFDESDLSINKMTPGHENRTLLNGLNILLPNLTGASDYKIDKQINFHRKDVFCSDENIEACWPWSRIYDRNKFIKDRVFANYSMWYSINQSVLLKELYAQRNEIVYDCVVISRFDVSPKISVDLKRFNLEKIISGYVNMPRREVNDWFIISNNKNSNIISSLFFCIDYHRDRIIENNGIWTNEAFLRDHLDIFGLKVETHDLQITF